MEIKTDIDGLLLAFHRLQQSRVRAKSLQTHNILIKMVMPIRLKIENVLTGAVRETFNADTNDGQILTGGIKA